MNYPQDFINKIICGDCLEVMKEIPDNSIDLVVTDPPYGSGGRDGSVHLCDDNIFGNRISSDTLVWIVREYSKLLFQKTKNNSHCYIFSDWRKFIDIKISFESNGWELRSLLIWNKGNGMGEYWRSCHEFILFFTKRKPRKLNFGNCFNVLNYNPVRSNKISPTQKPEKLFEFLIKASSNPNDIVLDPFLGSGTTALVCKQLGRRFIGIEISPEYCKIARNRVYGLEKFVEVKKQGE